MSEEIKDIGSLFQQSFHDYRVDSGVNEWALMKKKLFWQNFFKLSVHTFNVYYASLAVAASVFVSTEVYTYINNENPPQENNTPVLIQDEQNKIEIIEVADSVEHKVINEQKLQPDSFVIKDELKKVQQKEEPQDNSIRNQTENQTERVVIDTIEPEQIRSNNIDSPLEKTLTVDSVELKPKQNKPLKEEDTVEELIIVPDSVERKEVLKDSVVKVKKEVKIQVTPQQMREIRKKKRQQKKQNNKNNNNQ